MDEEYLIKWIHKLDVEKRLHGFITEAYFEKVLAPGRLKLENAAFGWMTASLHGDRRRAYWLKVATPNYMLSATEVELITAHVSAGNPTWIKDHFFVLHPELTGATLESSNAPLTFQVTEWGYNPQKKIVAARSADSLTPARRCLEAAIKDIDSRLPAHLGRQKRKLASLRSTPISIRPWLDNFSKEALIQLLATRCVINLVTRFAVDRDAINFQDSRLCYVEFKRKYPTASWWRSVSTGGFDEHFSKAQKLDRLYLEEFKAAPDAKTEAAIAQKWEKEIRLRLADPGQWLEGDGECFGLDLSHVAAVKETISSGAVFTHVIWTEKETELEALLTLDLKPKKPVSLRCFNLTPASFAGITFTLGKKASSFATKPRMQVLFRAVTETGLINEVEINEPG